MARSVFYNTAEVDKHILNFIRALPGEIERALIAEGNDVLQAAKELTPVDTGALKDSGMITEMRGMGSHETSVGIQFGGFEPSSNYAIFVHEDPGPHLPVGEYKFLEKAVNRATDGMLQRIGSRIKLERLV